MRASEANPTSYPSLCFLQQQVSLKVIHMLWSRPTPSSSTASSSSAPSSPCAAGLSSVRLCGLLSPSVSFFATGIGLSEYTSLSNSRPNACFCRSSSSLFSAKTAVLRLRIGCFSSSVVQRFMAVSKASLPVRICSLQGQFILATVCVHYRLSVPRFGGFRTRSHGLCS